MTGNVNIGVILVLFIGISLTYAVTLSVEEEQNAGAFVGTVDGVDNDYTLSDTHYFTLSEGRLYTNIKIDRESLSSDVIKLSAVSTSSSKQPVEIEVTVLDINDNDPTFPVPTVVLNLTESPSVNFKDRYELRISATDSGTNPRSGHLNVVVHVLDTNDNPPVFNLDKINYVFSEDTAVGSKLFTVKAEDKDSGNNGLVTYSLASQSEPGTFAVNASTGDLTLEKPLDYEDKRQHRLEIVATDGGSPSMNDNAFVNVEVTNVNDNDPIISFSYIPDQATIASIGEHEAVGSVVALVTVKDPDVDRIVNDVKMEVVKGNELGFFEIEKLKIAPHLATIKVANNESLGLQRSYNLTIRADDPDPTSSRFTLANMIILVNFGQNHPPTFDQKTYTVTLPETAPIGSVVISVHATDNDIGLNGRLAYSITKGDVLDWFTIDRTTGLITTTKSLDFGQTTTNGSISLTITAKDETTNALSDDTTVEITIWDENNNAPVFSMLEYSFNKTENSVGPAGKIRATDRDYGLNGEVQYSITSAKCISEKSNTMKNFGAAFTVEEGGTVKVTRGLNREHCDRYILKASASDMGKVPRKTIVDVIINVLDANDNSPVIYPIMYYERISPDTPVGTVLTKVIAYDVDLVDRDRITYRVSSASSYYDIDRNTGIVSLGKGVTRRDGEKHTVKFDAIDGDGNISSQKATLTVVINSTPDIKAHFSRKKYDFYLPENSNQNYSVGNVELESITGLARFEITNGNQDSAFGVDVQRGAIYVSNSSSLDAEKSSLRNLTIVAEINDASGDKTVGYLSVVCLVHVVDVNDNYPVFVSLSSNAFQVDSHVYADSVQILVNGNFERTTIYDAKAYDDDVSSRDRNLVYRIYSSSPEIEIDSSTGRVSYLPIEPSEMENLTVQAEILACDNELDSKCSKIQLNVTLKFIQNAIKDPLPNIHLNIPENALVGHQIATVPKLKDNFGIFDTARLDYSIEPEMPFRVYPRGEIVVSAELDHEKSVGHEMLLTTKIESNGKEWPKKSWMSLAVDDANDNFPTTAKKEHHFTIKESAKVGDIVGTVMVNDADSGVYGALTYEVQKEDERSVSGSDLFYCNKFTGDLFLTQTPDRKFLRLHNLNSGDITIKIVVSDQTGKNSSISTYKKTIIDVKITIDMENRNPLSFTSHTYYTEIRENLHTANILSVHATDADALWDTNMSAVHYSIYDAATKNASSRFSIGLLNGVIGLKDGVELDREEQDFYHLILKAEYADGSETAHSNVYIGVTDVKDSPPVFTQETYRFVISEDSLSLSSIGRVEARDGDVLTKRTHILYGFSSSDEERFGIDEISGFLFLLRPLNYSDQKQHIITVSAIDESDETSNATVIIDVTRTRDHIPRIKYQARSLIEGFYTSRQTLATPRYTESYTGQIQYSLLSPIPVTTSRSGGATFQVDHTTGYITAIGAIDRELTDKLKFVVRVSNDRTSKFEDISVTVNVKDRNDNLPAFTSRSSYVLTRASGLQAGHIIARITARDSDAGLNGAVTISLVNPPNPNFDLDRDGYLSIRSPLDTTKPVHNVELVATDRGSPPRSTRTSFHIILSDIAQSRTSDTSLSKVHLPETARKGSYVTTIQKTLARSVKTQFFLGAVTSSDGDKEINDKFTVDSTSGQIITNDGLIGFEGVYNIDVVTVEEPYQNGIAKISTRRVEVEISDENNNPPTFPKLTQRIAVSESARPGRIVATIKATDEDADSVITYSISSKTDDLGSDFVIDARSAVISVGRAGLDRERKSNYQLEVAADDGSHRSTTELLVDIEDVNDNPPRFNATPICFDLRENSPTGAFIGRLEAVDADLNSNVEYSIIDDESDSANFTVHAIYGTINFAGSSGLDREQQDLYVLRVKATDQDGLYSEGRVYIYITDENDHPPQLHITGSDTIEISEGTPIDSVIATIKGKDKDLGMNKEIYYSINSGDPEGKFRIGSYTGMIRISSSLDRENKGRYNLTIMGRNKYAGHGFEQVSYKSITVNLLDENDNDPQFSSDLVIYVDEDAAKGRVVAYVKAIDPDQDLDGKVRYYLMNQSPDNGIFRLNERSGQLVVIDNRDLDYEITKQYNLTLEARDRGHPHRKTVTHVLAQIVDANDHPPRFQKNTYTATLKENAAVGTRILRVVAEDSDAGFNSQIQYKLVPSSNASFLYIDRFTGEVSLFNVLDYEKQKEILVEIEASDGGVKALSDYSTLKVTVEDINDCSPVISPDHIILHVSENEINPSSLAEFTTVNQDPVKNCVADIRSSVRTLPNTDAFSLNVRNGGSSASLMLSKPLNRELTQQYELTITAGDPASPHKTGTTTVLVIVDDKNEFKPEFDQYEYFATISEDASPGTLTTRVKAVDADGPYIRYALHEDSKNMPFYIDQANGNVYLRGYLDREKVSQYNLSILAYDKKDSAATQHFSTVQLIIDVSDVNDNAPKFASESLDAYVDSSNSVGLVTVVEAIDSDFGKNGTITYSFVNNNPSFTIDSREGSISCISALTSPHNLSVLATDNGDNALSTILNIRVYPTDNRRPVFNRDVNSSPIVLQENIPENSSPRTFTASGNVKYYLIGDRYGWFTLDAASGQLTVTGNVDRETAATLQIWIEARETGSPQLSSFKRISVEIQDANDNAPLFTNANFTAHINEGRTDVLERLTVTDPDQGNNGYVTLSIVQSLSEDPGKFALSPEGEISNTVVLDRETKASYKLVIRATDGGSPALHRDVIFHVIVDDVNEHVPRFESLLSTNIPEDADIGDFVLKASSDDKDEFSNHSYRLTSNPGNYFNINRQGIITVARKLDREKTNVHRLQVESSDGRWIKQAHVTVRVDDANDNAPSFDKNKFEAAVSVGAGKGTAIVTVNASDPDIGYNGQVNYKISGGNVYFEIDQHGRITTSRELKCVKGTQGCPVQHHLTVVACDSGMPNIQCGSSEVVISIKSVNINAPQFTRIDKKIALIRSTTVGTKVYELSATDLDAGTVVSYEIMSGSNSDYFSLKERNHVILQRSLSSFAFGQQLTVRVTVLDDGVPVKSSSAELVFDITDDNLHSPRFAKSSYTASPIPENSTAGVTIISIPATDSDTGLNGKIVYEILKGNEDGKFGINEGTGRITLASSLDYEKKRSYELIIIATDSGMIRRNDTAFVTIPVQDVNDNVPYFNATNFEIRVFESTPIGKTIARFYAIDEDSGSNAEIRYFIEDQSVIDTEGNGNIYLDTPLDFEKKLYHSARIFAGNDGLSERNSTEIFVFVVGSNEFAPLFDKKEYDYNISHLSGHGTEVESVKATDQDEGADGDVEYFILPSQDSKNFQLDKSTGRLVVLDASSYEVGNKVNLTVLAKNPTTSSHLCLFDEAVLTIQIISNECHKQPCKNGGTCDDGPSNYKCSCLPGFTGIDCGINVDDCAPNPCVHGLCSDGVNQYQCTCKPGYSGLDCDTAIDFCEPSPCLNGGICSSGTTNFTCNCPFGAKGDTCEIQSLNFPQQSYIVTETFRNGISFEFSTVSSNALLFYSDLSSSTYMTLEILNGKLQLKVKPEPDAASELVALNIKKNVNDGLWHTITLTLQGRDISIFVTGCASGGESDCQAVTRLNRIITFSSRDLTVGGIQDRNVLQQGKLSSHDFVGCLRSLSIDSKAITSSQSPHIRQKHLVGDGCGKTDSKGSCSDNYCQNQATCTDLWSTVQCSCSDGWQGPRCESKLNGQTFTGEGYATISFTETFIRDTLLEKTTTVSSRKKRNEGGSSSTIEVRFRTKKNSGMLIAVIGSDDVHFGTLFIMDGVLTYTHQVTGELLTLKIDGPVSDGYWHNAKVEITAEDSINAQITLQLDYAESQSQNTQSLPFTYNANVITKYDDPSNVKNIYIGGVPQSVPSNVPAAGTFKGCMTYFKLNGIHQQLRSDVVNPTLSIDVNNGSISESCNGSGLACNLVTCENGRACVPDDITVSRCVCSNGYVEVEDSCVLPNVGGFDWWIIVVVLAVLLICGLATFVFVYKRRKRKMNDAESVIENGITSGHYDIETVAKSTTPDLVPQESELMSDDSERQFASQSSCDEIASRGFSSQVTLIPAAKAVNKNGFVPGKEKYIPIEEKEMQSGRRSATDILQTESHGFSITRPASAQATLIPDSLYTSVDRSRSDISNLYAVSSRTLPRKAPNKNISYLMDHVDGAPRRPGSRGRTFSGTRSATERRKQKRRSREVETLNIMMQELSGIAGLTKEEMDLLHAGAIALQKNNPDILYEDASSVSTSSVTDCSVRSKNTDSSRKTRNTSRSMTPRQDILRTPSPAVITNLRTTIPRLESKESTGTERYVSLSPFNFASPMFESDTDDPNSTSQDDDTWGSVTSDETAASVSKRDSGLSSSSGGSRVSNYQPNPLDLNFPSNLEEYFSSLSNVFDDISQLKSDKSKRTIQSDDPSKQPSVLPGFINIEASLWTEIEALSKKPMRRNHRKLSMDSSTPSSSGKELEGRATPIRKAGSRMNSPIVHDIIKEEVQDRKSPSSRNMSPIDLLESVENELDNNNKRRQTVSRSSSGRSNKSLKMKPEFIKFV